MQIIKSFLVSLLFVSPICLHAQSTYFEQGSKDNVLLNRLEIKMQKDTILNFSFLKPYNRKWFTGAIKRAQASGIAFSTVAQYNMQHALMNNMEWLGDTSRVRASKRSILNSFYKDPVNLVTVRQKEFFLAINPVLQLKSIYDNNTDGMLYLNTRGARVRSVIGNKIAIDAYLTETQEKAPLFVQQKVEQYRAVPGAGLYKRFKGTGYDYFDARGTMSWNVSKYIDAQFGYDKMFLGNGYRSLFFSDYSNSHLFLNLNLHASRFNYVTRFMELTSQYTRRTDKDTLFPRKYAVVHHLSFNAPKWLTLGLFESIVFGRPDHFEFSYLNPVMFLRVAELQLGSPDNSFIGFDAKANVGKHAQVYGQVLLDEFNLTYVRQKNGWWGNKWAFQGGLKYMDVFGINNLDLQLEANYIRPFTYSHFDTIGNYTHYNQPLAHPLMSNIKEYIGIVRYQPAPKWMLQGKVISWVAGSDPAGQNYGNNIFRSNDTRSANFGLYYGAPNSIKTINANFWVSYELKENLFLEADLSSRKQQGNSNNVFSSVGLRWNMQRREYDY